MKPNPKNPPSERAGTATLSLGQRATRPAALGAPRLEESVWAETLSVRRGKLRKRLRTHRRPGTAILLAASLLSGQLAANETLAVRGGTLLQSDGTAVENATLVIEDGVVRGVGQGLEIPFDATVIEAEGKVLFPGMVMAHTSRGIDASNESVPVTPYVDVYDSIDPSDAFYEDSLRAGVTTLHIIQGDNTVIAGMSRVVRPVGMTVEDMTVRPDVGLKIAIGPRRNYNHMTQMEELRRAFVDLDAHVMEMAEKKYEDDQKAADKKILLPPDEAAQEGLKTLTVDDLDQRWQNLYRLSKGELMLFLACEQASDVLRGIEFATSKGLMEKVVFVLGTETFKVTSEIKATGRPVILSGELEHRERDPLTREETITFVPKVFADAGIPFALQTSFGSMGEQYLWYQASRLVRAGIDRAVALGAITQTAADVCGVGELLGSLKEGKLGNLVILSGDPLAQSTVIEQVVIEGKLVYERAKDRRLKELLSGEELPVDSTEE